LKSAGKIYLLALGLGLLFLLSGCAGKRKALPAAGRRASGREAWRQLDQFKALKGTAVLSWENADGRHGKNRVRLFLAPPDRLKIQWLTPWGSVAGQLLVAKGHFWLSDARRHQTWYGRADALAACFPGESGVAWVNAGRFLVYWPLLFSSPAEDEKLLPAGRIEYSGSLAGDRLGKELLPAAGGRVGITLEDFEQSRGAKVFARRFTVSGAAGRVVLELRSYSLPESLPDGTFIYDGKHFNLYPCMDE